MAKKILFCVYGLGIGGIEKCLVNLINTLPVDQYQVDLLLMNPEEALKPEIKREVRYLDALRYVANTTDTMDMIRRNGGIMKHPGVVARYCAFRIAVKLRRSAWKVFHSLPEVYDIAVAYSQNDYSPYYVIDKVRAKRKILWYHNGAYEGSPRKYLRDKKYYPAFDYVVAVSSDCKKMLQERFELPDNQLIVLRNICDTAAVKEYARAFTPANFESDAVHIVTVGRMTAEKGADLAVEACRILCAEGRKICWHWIGDGNRSNDVRKKVKQLGLIDSFILEGNQTNPYPFVYSADIYAQTSYYEAYSTTVTEAKVLCRPIVTTDVGGMRDQLTDGVNAFIVPVDAEALAAAIRTLMDHVNLRWDFSEKLRIEYVDTNDALNAYEATVFS